MHDGILSPSKETTLIEDQQQELYPGLRVRRDGEAVVVLPMQLRRRNGRQMILTEGDAVAVPAT